jgi:hypothetical protein
VTPSSLPSLEWSGLWALHHRDACDFEVSTLVLHGDRPYILRMEALAIPLQFLGWSPWIPATDPRTMPTGVAGLYRLRRCAADWLTYIGQGQVGGRMRRHLAKAQQPGHPQLAAFTGSLELSWVDLADLPRRTLLEYENHLIASQFLTQGQEPAAQFLG